MDLNLKNEFDYYLAHQKELIDKYRGKYIVLKAHEVLGAYDTEETALTETVKEHELGTFLIQKCEPGPESYTQTYHSRVVLQ